MVSLLACPIRIQAHVVRPAGIDMAGRHDHMNMNQHAVSAVGNRLVVECDGDDWMPPSRVARRIDIPINQWVAYPFSLLDRAVH